MEKVLKEPSIFCARICCPLLIKTAHSIPICCKLMLCNIKLFDSHQHNNGATGKLFLYYNWQCLERDREAATMDSGCSDCRVLIQCTFSLFRANSFPSRRYRSYCDSVNRGNDAVCQDSVCIDWLGE